MNKMAGLLQANQKVEDVDAGGRVEHADDLVGEPAHLTALRLAPATNSKAELTIAAEIQASA